MGRRWFIKAFRRACKEGGINKAPSLRGLTGALTVSFAFAVFHNLLAQIDGEGIKLGLLRPITLWPFPKKAIADYAEKVKGMLSVELNAGQMVEDIRLAVNGKVKVEHFGRLGGIVFTPDEVLNALKEKLF